ncbi:MAG: hypothetical protein ACO3YN_11885, partial [Rubrivivax sp.]
MDEGIRAWCHRAPRRAHIGLEAGTGGGSVPSRFIKPRADDVGLVDLRRIPAASIIKMDISAWVAQDLPAALQPRRLAQRTLKLRVGTGVLIWHLRGYPQATRRLDELGA